MKLDLIESDDLFSLTPEERKQVIQESVELVLVQCDIISKTTNTKLSKIINKVLYNIELNKNIEEENENYELCYYYDELMWGVHNRLEELKKNKRDAL